MVQKLHTTPPLRFATFLSPVLYRTYEYIAQYVGECLGLPAELHTGETLAEFGQKRADLGFLCGLLYVHMARDASCPVEPLVAPVLQGERYRNAPLYYSDVIVRQESPYTSFADLRGCRWAYNERASHSGYNLVLYSLLQRGEGLDYFEYMLETGAHALSLKAVLDGKADATALDSHLLDVLLQEQPELARRLRVVEMLGPSTIPPLVIAKHLDQRLKRRIQDILLAMHRESQATSQLSRGRIARFVPITDEQYNDLRSMFDRVKVEKGAKKY